MTKKVSKHIHTYRRCKRNNVMQWRCDDPECYYLIDDELVRGKLSMCNRCHTNTLIMTPENRRRVAPVCIFCSTAKHDIVEASKVKIQEKLNAVLEGIVK